MHICDDNIVIMGSQMRCQQVGVQVGEIILIMRRTSRSGIRTQSSSPTRNSTFHIL